MTNSATSHLLPVFARVDLGFESGEGCWLTSTNGERYLDFTSGVAVNALGHAHPSVTKTITEQAAPIEGDPDNDIVEQAFELRRHARIDQSRISLL